MKRVCEHVCVKDFLSFLLFKKLSNDFLRFSIYFLRVWMMLNDVPTFFFFIDCSFMFIDFLCFFWYYGLPPMLSTLFNLCWNTQYKMFMCHWLWDHSMCLQKAPPLELPRLNEAGQLQWIRYASLELLRAKWSGSAAMERSRLNGAAALHWSEAASMELSETASMELLRFTEARLLQWSEAASLELISFIEAATL